MDFSSSTNVQDEYISQLKELKTPSTIFTTNGFQMRGVIRGYDNACIIVQDCGEIKLVYKHAISTIVPSQK